MEREGMPVRGKGKRLRGRQPRPCRRSRIILTELGDVKEGRKGDWGCGGAPARVLTRKKRKKFLGKYILTQKDFWTRPCSTLDDISRISEQVG